jgi:hypothetical protein
MKSKRPMTLSAAFVRTVNKPGRYGDARGGHGLSLLVSGARTGGCRSVGANGSVSMVGKPTSAWVSTRWLLFRRPGRRLWRIAVPSNRAAAHETGGRSAEQWRSSLERFAGPLSGVGVDKVLRLPTSQQMNLSIR